MQGQLTFGLQDGILSLPPGGRQSLYPSVYWDLGLNKWLAAPTINSKVHTLLGEDRTDASQRRLSFLHGCCGHRAQAAKSRPDHCTALEGRILRLP